MPLIPSLDTVDLTATDGPLRPSGVLEIKILGPLRIQCGDATLDASTLGGTKPRQILEILLLNLGTPVSKDRLIDVLWAGRPPAEALPTLESYVSVLRRQLQPYDTQLNGTPGHDLELHHRTVM